MRSAAILLAIAASGRAQMAPLTLAETVRRATERYPAIQVSSEQVAAAAAQIRIARLAYLPRVDMLAQANRATRNNVFGMLLPQAVIPPISGPVLAAASWTSVWGSGIGTLVSWEPLDFGYRAATVAVAEAGRHRAEASLVRTRFDVAALAADAYLTLLAAQQTERAAVASIERARTLTNIVETLVKSELRAGADLSRSRAEMAVAETQRLQAVQAIETARATIAQLLGIRAADVQVQPIADPPPESAAPASVHPAIAEQQSAIDEASARVRAVDRSFYPHFNLQGTAYGRGTGALPDGQTLGGINGLGPNVGNWGLGLTVTLPIMDLAGVHARHELEAAHERTERARLELVTRDLKAERDRAEAMLRAAREIATNTPVQLEAARAAERQANARYQSGLGTLIEVAEAQRLLTQAEIDDSLARLAIWRALLGVARANGDLDPVTTAAGR